MIIKHFSELPADSVDIRNEVFVNEQGFTEEFDTDDKTALHLVAFIDNIAVATCRIIEMKNNAYAIGRVAVRFTFRGKGVGSAIVSAAEQLIKNSNGKEVFIHSQLRAVPFYERLGYVSNGDYDEEEGCPHCMMIKKI